MSKLTTFEQLELLALKCASYTTAKILEYINAVNATIEELNDSKADSDHVHGEASTSAAGFMSVSDKTKLNGLPGVVKVSGTLSGLSWSSVGDGTYTQNITVSGVTASNDVLVSPTNDFREIYESMNCRCIAQAANSLTFECVDPQDSDITVTAIIYNFG